ncbi:cadherin-like domain-containing protein, partial [Poseidonibacter lekithochrous]|uniref:Ig-like domain-containing protein n=1 Tax=Poseidonibacter TaxID=2321187 RepID=UPI001C0922C0
VQLSGDKTVQEAEGAKLTHTITLVDDKGEVVVLGNGETITVSLAYSNDGTSADDFSTKYTEVTITGDGSTTSFDFSNIVSDDFLNELSESYDVKIDAITNQSGYFENIVVSDVNSGKGTILDNPGTLPVDPENPEVPGTPGTPTEPDPEDPENPAYGSEDTVYVQLSGDKTVQEAEGAKLTHTITLVDKDDNPIILANGETITVELAYTVGDTATDADFDPVRVTSVTITGNGTDSSFTFSNTITEDLINEGTESYDVKIDAITNQSGYFENIAIADVANGAKTTVNAAKGTITEEVELRNEAETVVEGASTITSTTESLNLLANDELGVGGKIVSFEYKDEDGNTQTATLVNGEATVNSQYGDITIEEDGTWSFTPDATENNLNGVDDIFTYTVQDSTGTTGTATFTIKVTDTNPSATAPDSILDEDDLVNGSDTNKESLIAEQTLVINKNQDDIKDVTFDAATITALDALNLESNGANITYTLSNSGHTITANNGSVDVFTIDLLNTNDASGDTQKYKFELLDTIDHPTIDAQDSIDLPFSFNISDIDSSVAGSEFKVTIVDDVPTANTEAKLSVVEGGVELTGMVNLLDNDVKGADEPLTTITGFTYTNELDEVVDGTLGEQMNTKYGSLTVNSDGSWSYTSDATESNESGDNGTTENDAVTDSFTYTITDFDGDTSSAVQDIDVTDGANPTIDPADLTITEVTLGSAVSLNPFTSSNNALNVEKGSDEIADTKFALASIATLTALGIQSAGEDLVYALSADKHTITATRTTGGEEVFKIVITDPASTDAKYDFTLSLPIDHTKATNDEEWTLPFSVYTVDTDNFTTEGDIEGINADDDAIDTFNVTIQDSTPSAVASSIETNEDTSKTIRLSQDDFGEFKITPTNNTEVTVGVGDTNKVDIYDINGDDVIGTLTNNGDGTVTFTPADDYSNYNVNPTFDYTITDNDGDTATATVTIKVNPIADAPGVTVADVTTIEDANSANDTGNEREGENSVALGLTKPTLSKDQIDQNDVTTTATGDNPERLGYIELKFANGEAVNGAVIEKVNGDDLFTLSSNNQVVKIFITDDAEYHHAGLNPDTDSGTILKLTTEEYQGLKIIHAEDNDTDIKINIKTTSYEVDDAGVPLGTSVDLTESKSANMTVKINPATDDISLIWDTSTGGTISADNKTFTFDTKTEGGYFDTPIDLKDILTKTSGTQNDTTPLLGDLDGSEKRTYTVSGIPEGTVITVGTQTAVAGSDGIATLVFNNTNNKDADPEFSMKLPEQYSGTVNGTIKLSVQDIGVDSGDTPSNPKTAEVYFNVEVTPVADLATIQVSQAVGFEDAGRSKGNTEDKDGTIDKPEDGIALDIKVSSDDKDGSETFNVTISEVPDDGAIYYNGGLYNKDGFISGTDDTNVSVDNSGTGWAITINEYDNNILPKFIPAHNDDTDYTLNVSAETKDGDSVAAPTVTNINVIVKNVADAPVETDLNDNINVNEDNQLNLRDIYSTPANLVSYDNSEELTVKIELTDGFTIDSGSPFYIEDGLYVVKASDIIDGDIKLVVPENFSGNASFDLTYVTTEKAGENDSKTWDPVTVSIFVNPIADNVVITETSTIYEDADGSANKLNLKPTLIDADTAGEETIASIKFLATEVPAGYKLYSDENMTNELTETAAGYYELTAEEADSVYVKNTADHDLNNVDSFDLSVIYTVTDTNTSTDTNDFTHTHTVNVKAVTDAPTLTVGDITTEDNITIDNENDTVTVNADDSEFNVAVTTSSPDADGSETVQKIVISGVPTGVSVEGATYYGYSGSEANGIWVITAPTDNDLDTDGALENIKFKINSGADFEDREMTITTYTKDGADAEVKEASQTINIVRNYTPGTEPGTPAELNLALKATVPDIDEDVQFNLGSILEVTQVTAGNAASQSVITFTDIPEGSTVSGYDYSYEQDGKTHYVVTGNGNVSDMNTVLSQVLITTPKDMNSGQEGDLKGNFTLTADIVTSHNGAFKEGNTVTLDPEATISPITDAMTVAVTADNINEDGKSNLSITLSNPSDGTKTELVGSSLTIKVTEDWKDSNTNGEGTEGTLTQTGTEYNIVDNNDGTYTITKTDNSPFTVDTAITGLQYAPALNRDGDVNFEVSVKNKETGSTLELDSKGNTTITVSPEIDVVIDTSVVTATGTEDKEVTVGSTTLGNSVRLEITTASIVDGSEKYGNIILDEVPNGFTVWYNDGTDLVMATNIGTTDGGTFDTNPGITGDAEVTRNKWLVPATSDGSKPEVYINAPENWSGEFDFKAKFTVSEENLSTVTPMDVDVTGKITSVADDITIAPTLTFGDAFSWVDLKLNANMEDVDGSETMSLELTGLDQSAQFQLTDGTAVNATLDGSTWKLDGIAFDQINNIQFIHDKDVTNVGVTAKTVDGTIVNTIEAIGTFKLDVSDVSGNLKLDTGLSLNFDNIDALSSSNTLKNIDTIDLSENGENNLLNLSLQDVIDMTDSSNELKITGTSDDDVTLKGNWEKGSEESGFDVYTNTDDDTVKVKVQTDISDGITN